MPQKILICHYPGQQDIFTITREAAEAALAKAPKSLPPVEFLYRSYTDPDLSSTISECDAMVAWQVPCDAIRNSRGHLRLVQLSGAGVDHLAPFDWLPPNTVLANASGIHGAKLQEWSAMCLLMLHSHMPHFVTAQRAQQWSKRHSSAIAGKTALIYGTGGLGQAVARAAASLGVRSIGIRRSPAPVENFEHVVGPNEAAPHLATADFVVLTLPLTPQTKGLANAAFFAAMQSSAGFINFGRGGLVVEADLIAALNAEEISGAIIDVTAPEPPPPGSPLWETPRLIITPHISCDDPATYVPEVLALLFDNLDRLLNGREPRNLVNLELAY